DLPLACSLAQQRCKATPPPSLHRRLRQPSTHLGVIVAATAAMTLHAPPPSFSGQSSGRPSVHQCWPAQSSVDRRRVLLSLIVVAALPLDIHSDLAAHLGSTSDPAASMAF
ncbi:hypothetical protein LINGRAHAP2_LOCUS10096, partial [Linum grandiflorum]